MLSRPFNGRLSGSQSKSATCSIRCTKSCSAATSSPELSNSRRVRRRLSGFRFGYACAPIRQPKRRTATVIHFPQPYSCTPSHIKWGLVNPLRASQSDGPIPEARGGRGARAGATRQSCLNAARCSGTMQSRDGEYESNRRSNRGVLSIATVPSSLVRTSLSWGRSLGLC